MYVTDAFYHTLCAVIGQRNCTNTLPILRRWQQFEGGNAEWNPFNTTERWDGSSNYNSAGVQNYQNEVDGVNATAHTLRNGYYPNIVQAIQLDAPLEFWTHPAVIAQVRKWGTTGLANWLASQPKTPVPTPILTWSVDDMLIIRADNGDYFLHGGKMVGITTPVEEAKLTADKIAMWDVRGDKVQYDRLIAAYPAT